GATELAAAHVERGEAEAQERRVGIGPHRYLEGGERRLHVVLRERHLALQEAAHRDGIRRRLDRRTEAALAPEQRAAAQPRAARRQEREHHHGGGAGTVHEPRALTMAKECRQRKPCPGGSGRGVTAAAYDEQRRRAVGGEP